MHLNICSRHNKQTAFSSSLSSAYVLWWIHHVCFPHKISLECIWIYAADVISRQLFQDKTNINRILHLFQDKTNISRIMHLFQDKTNISRIMQLFQDKTNISRIMHLSVFSPTGWTAGIQGKLDCKQIPIHLELYTAPKPWCGKLDTSSGISKLNYTTNLMVCSSDLRHHIFTQG